MSAAQSVPWGPQVGLHPVKLAYLFSRNVLLEIDPGATTTKTENVARRIQKDQISTVQREVTVPIEWLAEVTVLVLPAAPAWTRGVARELHACVHGSCLDKPPRVAEAGDPAFMQLTLRQFLRFERAIVHRVPFPQTTH